MEIMMRTTYGVEVAGERLDIERVTSRSEGSGWKSTCRGNSRWPLTLPLGPIWGAGWVRANLATRPATRGRGFVLLDGYPEVAIQSWCRVTSLHAAGASSVTVGFQARSSRRGTESHGETAVGNEG